MHTQTYIISGLLPPKSLLQTISHAYLPTHLLTITPDLPHTHTPLFSLQNPISPPSSSPIGGHNMQNPTPSPPPKIPEMSSVIPVDPSSSLFDWSEFLDFGILDDDNFSFPPHDQTFHNNPGPQAGPVGDDIDLGPGTGIYHNHDNNVKPVIVPERGPDRDGIDLGPGAGIHHYHNNTIRGVSGPKTGPEGDEIDLRPGVGLHQNRSDIINPIHAHGPGPGPDRVEVDSGPGPVEGVGRVRKRDPRLVCSNFLAGRVPCACPELDEEEEMNGTPPGKRRAQTAWGTVVALRCQVPGCEVDISELKGYHKRHRVCLRCANASYVLLDGEGKRYCQQCGKFHLLSDFDEGKRSCRRKLERHNNRRRRKPTDSKGSAEKESEQVVLAEDVSCDDDTDKDAICLSSQIAERETLVEPEGQLTTFSSAPGSQVVQSDSVISYTTSSEALIEVEKENLKYNHSPTYCDNKSAFSSVCPTGRISFKLYDWNPAEFPRRLRHQIFQWLASMPVELEGYIRPGCTIFTVFVAMPKFMWVKLSKEPAPCIHNFIVAPGNMLCGRGTILVHLSNMIFRVMRDGSSVMKVKVKQQAPKLHHIHPTCFEAGKPMEFIACGSNLLQPKFRFLLSFAGKYMACDSCISSCGENECCTKSSDHQVVKIYVPQTEPGLFGPAFIEVENESGVSNFIPILIGDKEICAEIRMMQQRFYADLSSERPKSTNSSCEVSVSRQVEFSQFILDVAWSLREPMVENAEIVATTQVQRFNNLLKFLIENESTAIMERVLRYVKILMDNNLVAGVSDADMRVFRSNIDMARNILSQKKSEKATSQGLEVREICKVEARMDSTSLNESTTVPLLDGEVFTTVNVKEWPGRSSSHFFAGSLLTNRSVVYIIAAAAVCFGLCAVLLHPKEVERFATTIRRCLFTSS